MKHTKGPWLLEKRDGHSDDGVRPVITSRSLDVDGRIAVVSYRGVPSVAEADANACLLTASPGLLAACEWLLETMDKDSAIWCAIREHDGCSEWVKGLRATVDKATT